jgi:hypothetical protein
MSAPVLFVYKRPNNEVSAPVSVDDVMAVARTRVDSGAGPFDLKRDDLLVRTDVSRADELKALRRRMGIAAVGETLRARDGRGDLVLWVRAVAGAPVDSTNGNEHADEFFNWIVGEFAQYHPRFAGSYVCKSVAGTSTPSQHSYGNADDFFFDSIEHQRAVFAAVVRGECPVPIAHAISEDHIWDGRGTVSHYSGEFHSHLHTDYLPQFSGSCGVREP